ncbi:MAG: hypothetical protein ACRD9R_10525 [Pyrinomonadaceae bacterium]
MSDKKVTHRQTVSDNFFAGEAHSPRWIKFAAGASAVLLSILLLGGYFYLRQSQVARLAAEKKAQDAAQTKPSPEAHVREDEARLKGSDALIGGTITNISSSKLENLYLEIELMRRTGGGKETRRIKLTPSTLQPGEEGRYSLTISPRDWSSTRITKLSSDRRPHEIAFKSSLGEKRPAERLPANQKIVVVPRPRSKGEEFINTPNTAIPIK